MTPILSNHLFAPANLDLGFRAGHLNGICFIRELYIAGIFASFNQLSEKNSLSPPNFFCYLQIRDFVRKGYTPFPNEPLPTIVDELLSLNPDQKGSIARIYSFKNDLTRNPWII